MSLPDDDVEFVDDYARRTNTSSRSSVVHRAIELLRVTELGDAYEAAWDEWYASEDAALWEKTIGDGITDATR